MKVLYTATVKAMGGREGKVESSDGILKLPLAMPKSLGGPGGNATNPEQLFAAGYAACFESALRLVARQQKASAEGASVTAEVSLVNDESGAFGLKVALKASLPALDAAQARSLMEKAHQICPYSVATRGNIQVDLSVG